MKKFCVISPMKGLNQYSILSKRHLILAHVSDIAYWRFYEKRRDAGDHIILDNGAYEGEMVTAGELYRLAISFKPSVLVLPDSFLNHYTHTLHLVNNFLKHYDIPPEIELMVVPQARRGEEDAWWRGLDKLANLPRISWIGLSRVVATSIFAQPHARPGIAQYILDNFPHLKIHALGMVRGDVNELRELSEFPNVHGIDSGAPVWRGWKGYRLDDVRKWPDPPLDFKASPPSILNHQLILKNLEMCGVNTGRTTSTP